MLLELQHVNLSELELRALQLAFEAPPVIA
jgi:hypothetical protein